LLTPLLSCGAPIEPLAAIKNVTDVLRKERSTWSREGENGIHTLLATSVGSLP